MQLERELVSGQHLGQPQQDSYAARPSLSFSPSASSPICQSQRCGRWGFVCVLKESKAHNIHVLYTVHPLSVDLAVPLLNLP